MAATTITSRSTASRAIEKALKGLSAVPHRAAFRRPQPDLSVPPGHPAGSGRVFGISGRERRAQRPVYRNALPHRPAVRDRRGRGAPLSGYGRAYVRRYPARAVCGRRAAPHCQISAKSCCNQICSSFCFAVLCLLLAFFRLGQAVADGLPLDLADERRQRDRDIGQHEQREGEHIQDLFSTPRP